MYFVTRLVTRLLVRCSVPLTPPYTPLHSHQATKIFRIVRVMRVLRVFRLMKLNRLFSLMEEQLKLNPSLVRLVKNFFMLLFLWHWVGCLWLFIANFERDDNEIVFEENLWVPPAYIWQAGEVHQWIYALYWAMAVTLGVGMDIYPHTVRSKQV